MCLQYIEQKRGQETMFELDIINFTDIFGISIMFSTSLYLNKLIYIKKNCFIVLELFIILSLILTSILTQVVSFFIIFIGLIFSLSISNKLNELHLLNIIFAYVIMIVTTLVSDIMIGFILFEIFELNKTDLVDNISYNILCIMLTIIENKIINKVFSKHLNQYESEKNILKEYISTFNMLMLIMLIALLMILYHSNFNRKITAVALLLVCFIAMINQYIYIYFYQYKVNMYIKNEKLKVYNENLLKYNQKIEKVANEIITFKHNSKNMHYSLMELVKTNENEELKEFYFNKIFPISNTVLQKESIYINLINIELLPLKSILYCKLCEAIKKNIQVNVNIANKVKFSRIDSIELVMILGIFLDNAIEECEKKNDTYISINIYHNIREEIYIIENSLTSNLNLLDMKQGLSTKGAGRGNGLKIVKKIADNYNFLIVNTEIKQDIFRQTIVIER